MRFVDRRHYTVGLIVDTVSVDGGRYRPDQFIQHDLLHAWLTEDIRLAHIMAGTDEAKRELVRRVFERFRYDEVTRDMDARSHQLFNLAHFLALHESLGAMRCCVAMRNLESPVSPHDFKRAYLEKGLVDRHTVRRFLNPRDLRVNLPIEVRDFIAQHPRVAHRTVHRLLVEAAGVYAEPFGRSVADVFNEEPRPVAMKWFVRTFGRSNGLFSNHREQLF